MKRLSGSWTLFATDRRVRSGVVVAGVFETSEGALKAAQRLWKKELRPTRIIGPRDAVIELPEIEAFGASNLEKGTSSRELGQVWALRVQKPLYDTPNN